MKSNLLFCLALLFSLPASAQFFTGPAASGTGGAGRAAIDGSEAPIINPATLGYIDRYYITAPFAEGSHDQAGYSQTYGIMAADGGVDKIVPGALSYLRRRTKVGGLEVDQQDVHVALAGRGSQYFSFGIAGHYRTYETKVTPDYFQTNFDLGTMITPLENFGIALVAYNVRSADENVPLGIQDVPSLAAGFNYLYGENFSARLDFVRPDKFNSGRRTNVHAGIQTTFEESLFMRAGASWKETENRTLLTVGTGYQGPRLSFNYAFEHDLRALKGQRHLVDLWLLF